MPRRIAAAVADDRDGWSLRVGERLRALPRLAARNPFDTAGLALAAAIAAAILVNALWLQTERHPAPLSRADRLQAVAETGAPAMPRPRPAALAPAAPDPASAPAAPARSRKELLADIQRELARRGFYDGPPDGIYGPKMDAAIRDFEAVAKLKPSPEPSEALLQAIAGSAVRVTPEKSRVAAATGSISRPPAPLATPATSRIVAAQRALADYGYGQLRVSGVLDDATKTAIQKFERDRRLPVTGQVSDRLLRELATVTGRPLD